jgi:hypothetical protein
MIGVRKLQRGQSFFVKLLTTYNAAKHIFECKTLRLSRSSCLAGQHLVYLSTPLPIVPWADKMAL